MAAHGYSYSRIILIAGLFGVCFSGLLTMVNGQHFQYSNSWQPGKRGGVGFMGFPKFNYNLQDLFSVDDLPSAGASASPAYTPFGGFFNEEGYLPSEGRWTAAMDGGVGPRRLKRQAVEPAANPDAYKKYFGQSLDTA